jgi:phospholipid transport system substrate-binding protein
MSFAMRAAILMAVAASPVAVAAQASSAAARVGAYNAAIVSVMKSGGGLARRADAFEPIVREYYDMPAVSGLVFGPGWAKLSASDRATVTKALTRHSAVSLARNFTSYDGERFTVAPNVVTRGMTQLVTVTIASKGGSGDTLIYRLRET